MSIRTELLVERQPFSENTFNFLFRHVDLLARRVSFGQLALVDCRPEDRGIAPVPTFTLRPEQAQELMDELWRCGLRPTEGSGSAGALAAVQAHLQDMRKLVFEKR